MNGLRVRKIDKSGLLTVIAGSGAKGSSGDGGPALQAQFNGPHNLAVTPDGEIYVADTWNNRVRKIDAGRGSITTVAGTGVKGFGGDDGAATQAQFGGIYCASLDPQAENLFLADLDNLRIRQVNLKTGRVHTVAGNGKRGVPEDGARAVAAPLVDPRAVIADGQGRIYILERSGHALRVVEPDGTIKTVVGTGKKGFNGDGGAARQAMVNEPKHLCFDRDGDVIIADTDNHVIRKRGRSFESPAPAKQAPGASADLRWNCNSTSRMACACAPTAHFTSQTAITIAC
jgi:DNA-binding beta-propeller fold protein YncE